jgi:hypothetical protein
MSTMLRFKIGLALLHLLAVKVTAGVLQAGIKPRVVETSYITSWVYSTLTVNPLDSTITEIYDTITVYESTATATLTAGCTSWSYYRPGETATSDPNPTTTTRTITRTSWITVSRTDKPIVTYLIDDLVTKSESGTTTEYSTICTNTLVQSLYEPSATTTTRTHAAEKWVWVTVTEVCLTSTTLQATIPGGGPVPTPSPKYHGGDLFASTTLVTIPWPEHNAVEVVITSPTVTLTSTVCNNPTFRTSETWYVYTVTSTLTSYTTGTDCVGPAPTASTGTQPIAASTDTVIFADSLDSKHRNAGMVGRAASIMEVGGRTPVRVETTTYLTTIGIGSIPSTYSVTAIIEVNTKTFTWITMIGYTVTSPRTVTLSVCRTPTSTGVVPTP